jgi:hypothetical protein
MLNVAIDADGAMKEWKVAAD